MKAVTAKDTLLAYPDHNLPFHVETDASDYQLGGRLYQMQQNDEGQLVPRDIAFYSWKLSGPQKNYTTIEKELLGIVETMKNFQDMIYGGQIHIYTDHKNLTYKLSQFSTQRVTRWRLLLEDYGAQFKYKPGPENVVADALSRVPMQKMVRERENEKPLSAVECSMIYMTSEQDAAYCMFEEDPAMAECLMHDPEIGDAFLEHPVFDKDGKLPFQFKTLEEYQRQNDELQSMPVVFPDRFSTQQFGDSELICFHQNGEDKIVLTKELVP